MEVSSPVPPTRHQFRAATAARRAGARSPASAGHDEAAFAAEPEPSMKLSRAIAVVLLLHVVAVGGVLAFGLIKPPPKPGTVEVARVAPPASEPAAGRVAAGPPAKPAQRPPAVLATASSSRLPAAVPENPAASSGLRGPQDDALRLIEGAGPAASGAKPARADEAGGRAYVVARGDTPFSIAKRHGVSEASLLRANSIDDPRKLQVGQRLIIPAR